MTTADAYELPPVTTPVTTPDTTPVALMTAEELLVYTMPDKRVELVRGHVVVREPPGMHHGECAVRVVVAISTFLNHDRALRSAPQTRGRVFTCDTGFTLARNPDTVRGPDVAYGRARGGPARCLRVTELAGDRSHVSTFCVGTVRRRATVHCVDRPATGWREVRSVVTL